MYLFFLPARRLAKFNKSWWRCKIKFFVCQFILLRHFVLSEIEAVRSRCHLKGKKTTLFFVFCTYEKNVVMHFAVARRLHFDELVLLSGIQICLSFSLFRGGLPEKRLFLPNWQIWMWIYAARFMRGAKDRGTRFHADRIELLDTYRYLLYDVAMVFLGEIMTASPIIRRRSVTLE